ncbi:DUF3977 family protein [Solibacillus silvestris]|uniref:DUF3977 family protein n=1 Tax=Solibacillus silvestris TaxID=76853 RepID=UPI003F8124F6
MKFIEFGIGNTWFVRTETELEDGSEYEEKGIVGPIKFQSAYIRIWVRKNVFIIDLKQGIRLKKKSRNELKLIFGIVSM